MLLKLKSIRETILQELYLLPVILLIMACNEKRVDRNGKDGIAEQDSIPSPNESSLTPEKESDDEFVCVYDEPQASFPGGEKACYEWIEEHLHYPPEAKAQGIQGRVFVQFTVGIDGIITDVQVVRGPDQQLIDEAIRIVKAMPRWNPATSEDGKAIPIKYYLPIIFKLPESK